MPKTRAQKEQSVKDLTDKLAKAKSVVFTDYRGWTMSQLSQIRGELRPQNSELAITKNNLLKLALKDSGLEMDEKLLEGPTATLFAFDDEIGPIKVVAKAIKDTSNGTVKGGFLEGEFLGAASITKLSTLPSKDELRGKVVGTLGAPLYGIVGVLQANLRNLVYVVDSIRTMKASQ